MFLTTLPKKTNKWIASTRLEEIAEDVATARRIITRTTAIFPTSKDIRKEAARFNSD